MHTTSDHGPRSTVAIICYCLIGVFALTVGAFFMVIFSAAKIEDALLTVLGTILAIEGNAISAVGGFWLASSVGSRATSAAIAQLAGAGPPPPAPPLETEKDA